MKQLLETLMEETKDTLKNAKANVLRNFTFPKTEKLIKVAIGMRRTGKTYFLYQCINSLIENGVPNTQILYINFDDDRLFPLNQKQMAELIESFYSIYPENHEKRCYLFLDEVQNIDGWEAVVRRFFDTKDTQIYLTGSSAKLLSKEIATSLRGRSLAIEIWPYDFSEYIRAHNISIPQKPWGKKSLDVLNKNFLTFLMKGGFPAIQDMEANLQIETLQSYTESVIFRDIIERYKVTNIALLRYLTINLLKNISSRFSNNKFFNSIKSQGYQAGKDTIYNYINYLEDAYLIFTVPIFSENIKRQSTTPNKIYAIDNGLIRANTLNFSEKLGALFENQVYLTLRRQGKHVYYYQTKSGYEVDFITEDSLGKREIIQVCSDLKNDSTRTREERALHEAQEELGLPGQLIDLEQYLKDII